MFTDRFRKITGIRFVYGWFSIPSQNNVESSSLWVLVLKFFYSVFQILPSFWPKIRHRSDFKLFLKFWLMRQHYRVLHERIQPFFKRIEYIHKEKQPWATYMFIAINQLHQNRALALTETRNASWCLMPWTCTEISSSFQFPRSLPNAAK